MRLFSDGRVRLGRGGGVRLFRGGGVVGSEEEVG